MRTFFLAWPPYRILQAKSAKSIPLEKIAECFSLPWPAYVRLLSVKSEAARSFYEDEYSKAIATHSRERADGSEIVKVVRPVLPRVLVPARRFHTQHEGENRSDLAVISTALSQGI